MAQISTSYIMITLSCLNVMMFFYTLLNRRKRPMAYDLLWILLLALEWNISITFRSMTAEPGLAIVFHELKFVGAALLPVWVFIVMAKYTGLGRLVQQKQVAALSVVPVFTILLSQTNPWHHIFRKGFDILYQPDGAFYIHAHNNYWFYVHSIYSYSLWVASIIILMQFYRRCSPQNRLQAGIFIAAIIFPVLTNVIDFLGLVKAYDLTVIAYTVSIVMMLYAVFFYSDYDLVPLARIKLVDSMPNPIFIYNHLFKLTDANRAAVKLAGKDIKEIYGQSRDYIMKILPIRALVAESLSYCLLDPASEEEQIWSLESKSVSKSNDGIAAYIDILTDITALENAKREIEKMAITDSLTSLFNRNYFDYTVHRLEQESHVPVGLIIGDVNGLKRINDTLGHARGDVIIRRAAMVMKNAVRSGDVVARIGGDEFAILLENVNQNDIERILDKIKANCRAISPDETALSISLGYALRKADSRSMEELIRLADENMYKHKREIYSKG